MVSDQTSEISQDIVQETIINLLHLKDASVIVCACVSWTRKCMVNMLLLSMSIQHDIISDLIKGTFCDLQNKLFLFVKFTLSVELVIFQHN